MKNFVVLRAALACLMMLTFAGCAGTDVAGLREAAVQYGITRAKVDLPDWPDECRRTEAHAALVKGADTLSVLDRERNLLARQNERLLLCADHYDHLQGGLRP